MRTRSYYGLLSAVFFISTTPGAQEVPAAYGWSVQPAPQSSDNSDQEAGASEDQVTSAEDAGGATDTPAGLKNGDTMLTDRDSDDVLAQLDDVDELAASTQQVQPPSPGTWRENANRLYFDSVTKLAWRNELGDYYPTPLGSAFVPDIAGKQRIRIAVPAVNDFYLKTDNNKFAFYVSSEGAAADAPALVVNGRTIYRATRDTDMSVSSIRPHASLTELRDQYGILMAFDGYRPRAGDRVELQLTSFKHYGDHRVTAYTPRVEYTLPTIPDVVRDSTVVRNFDASEISSRPNVTIANGVAAASISGRSLAWLNDKIALPPANEYYMTTVMKLGANWPDAGGKLPGLGNSGQATNRLNFERIINGINCNNAGWGGRTANGCRWSARTGWSGRSQDEIGLSTYFYAYEPKKSHGIGEAWPMPAPTGKWFAIIQRVRVNRVGEADGLMSYWLCLDSGCFPQYHRDDLVWRTADLPEALVSEMWVDVYCGGTNCGSTNLPVTYTYFKRATATRGLPDTDAIAAEVRRLNGN